MAAVALTPKLAKQIGGDVEREHKKAAAQEQEQVVTDLACDLLAATNGHPVRLRKLALKLALRMLSR